MNILGIGAFCDASASIVAGGRIVCAVEEERLNRMQHYEGLPGLAIDECLRIAGMQMSDVDAVAVGWHPWKGWATRIGKCALDSLRSPQHFRQKAGRGGNYLAGISQILHIRRNVKSRYGIGAPAIHYVPHHHAHAASSYFGSEYERANIIVADGVGESGCVSFFEGRNNKLIHRRAIRYPHSLGHLYASVTAFLGFRPACDEGKVMALASYGSDMFRSVFERICPLTRNGRGFRLDTRVIDYHQAREGIFTPEWLRLTGMTPRRRDDPLEKRHEDLACSLQASIERTVFALLETEFGAGNGVPLCAAGGLFLNSVLNGRLVREYTPHVFIQPASGDNGVSIGAALYVTAKLDAEYRRSPVRHSFYGTSYSERGIAASLEAVSEDVRQPHDRAASMAEDIAAGLVVARFCGAMEFGPRALGNRSILASPSHAHMKDTLNRKVKHREAFRPFAAAMLLEDIGEYFETPSVSPYMLKVFYFKQHYRGMFPAICHVDGSCRLQTVTKDGNPDLYELLIAMKRRTGHGVVLNTSLNVAGEPIVRTPEEALRLLRATDVDVLYMGRYRVEKKREEEIVNDRTATTIEM